MTGREDAPEKPEDADEGPREGVALCLSGGGYRAMLFHLGAIWRLNEFGYLPRMNMISGVSGGAITAGVLGYKWLKLAFDPKTNVASNFVDEIVMPLLNLASTNIDVSSIIKGLLSFSRASAVVANRYDRLLFNGATLQALPDDAQSHAPRFVFNATNLQTGSDWRFSRRYMADYKIGLVPNPKVHIAEAVTASGAFPPVLSPFILRVKLQDYDPDKWGILRTNAEVDFEALATRVMLTDGGVYDNMGLEPAFKNFNTILVSDGGMQIRPHPGPGIVSQLKRVLDLVDSQVRSRRKVELITAFKLGGKFVAASPEDSEFVRRVTRKGAYWRTDDNLEQYQLPSRLSCPFLATQRLAQVPTRLDALDDLIQQRLINFGYAACDVHMRMWVDMALPPPDDFPYSKVGVGG